MFDIFIQHNFNFRRVQRRMNVQVDFSPHDFTYLFNLHFGRDCFKKGLEDRLITQLTKNFDDNDIISTENVLIKVADVLFEPIKYESFEGEKRSVKESKFNDYDIVRRLFPTKYPFVDNDIKIFSLEVQFIMLL
jgi:hypothetical protein